MPWSLLFVIGLAQGIFLIVVFATRNNGNRRATRLLQVLLALFTLSNFDDLLLSTGWYRITPWLFGYSMLSVFAYGPLFYLYVEATTDAGFAWKPFRWLHFLPAFLNFLLYFPWLVTLPPAVKIRFLDKFVAGELPVRPFDAVLNTVQVLHFAIYMFLTFRLVRTVRSLPPAISFQVPLPQRAGWLNTLLVLFSMMLPALTVLFVWNIASGQYVAGANFVFTLITSSILYFIAYKLMLQPELVTPGFSKKYHAIRFGGKEEQELLLQLKRVVEEGKRFTDPDLTLVTLAAQLKISPHRLSMFVNEKFDKSFSDFINQYRVQEFIARLNDPRYAHLTVYGLALEVGFNSKSAFNAAFKKTTGKTPSAFKRMTGSER